MNIETVRSLTEFVDAVADLVASSKGANFGSFKKAKICMISAIATEQDLRDIEFMNACQRFYASFPAQEAKGPVTPPSAVTEAKKPVPTAVVIPMPPAKSPSADLTAKKS